MTLPPAVATAFHAMPRPTRAQALALRDLILAAAEGPVTETLKWGQPAYLPGKAGTTVRIGWDPATGDCQLLVHCATSLVEGWRTRFQGRLTFEGNRAIRLPLGVVLDEPALRACVAEAFTYHRRMSHA